MLASSPGRGEGKSGMVTSVCACAKNPLTFRKIAQYMCPTHGVQ